MKKTCQHKRSIDIIEGWSYFCLDCGRLNIDGLWQNKGETISCLEWYLDPLCGLSECERDRVRAAVEIVKLK